MSSVAAAWAEALLHSLWQVPLLAVLAWLVESAWASRATTRHAIRAAALLLVPPMVLATWWHGLDAAGSVTLGAVPMASPGVVASAETGSGWASGPSWSIAVLAAWTLGLTVMAVRTLGQWRAVALLRRSAVPLPEAWQRRARALARSLGVRVSAFGASAACEVPLVLGVLRPLVLLPAGLCSGVAPEVVEAALVHELMHLRRLDPWIALAQVLVEIALFFNPAVWWLSRRVSCEREHACDEAVLRARRQPPLPYARALVELEAWRHAPALTVGLGGPGLAARVRHLVQPRRVSRSTRIGARTSLVVLGIAVLTIFGQPSGPIGSPTTSTSDAIGVAWLPASVRRHEQAIAAAADRHGVDRALLAIVVWAESRGRPDARSPVGARGLLQLMPATAEDIARQRGLAAHHDGRLDEPAYNLDLGAWYLARQLERYDQDLDLALAAYNAGPGRVAAYRRGEATLPRETQRYQAVIKALWSERALPYSPTLAARG